MRAVMQLVDLQDWPHKALALLAAYLLVQLVRFVIVRRHAHQTFERMKIAHLKPASLIRGQMREILTENTMNFFDRLHKTCGKTAGYFMGGDPIVATAEPEIIQEVFVEKSHIFHDRPARLEVEPMPQSIFMLEGERWRLVRKVLTPAFASSKIKSDQFYQDTQETLEKFIAQLEKNSQLVAGRRETFVADTYDRMAACALDVIVKSMFRLYDSVSFEGPLQGGTRAEKNSWLIGWREWLLGAIGKRTVLKGDSFLEASKQAILSITNPAALLTYCFPELDKPLSFFCNYLYLGPLIDLFFTRINTLTQQAKVEREKGADVKRRRIVDFLLEEFREGKLSLNEVKGNALTMVLAGFETTANALTFTLWLLAKHEPVQRKLRKQLLARMSGRHLFKSGEGIKVKSAKELTQAQLGELVADCEYLEAVINESLRLFPPAPAITYRQAKADCVLSNGLPVEKGVIFAASIFAMHRDETLWGREAHLFKPERFEMLDANQLKSAMFMPFGIGQRVCLGRSLAMQEMKIIIGRLLLDYSVGCWAGKTAEKLNLTTPTVVAMASADKVALKFVKL